MLSVLADLLADKRAPPFFLEWHAPAAATGTAAAEAALSTSSALGVSASAGALGSPVPAGVTAAQLLISIWRGQDQARGLSGPDGLLANRIRPLAGSGSRTKWAVGEAGVAGGYGVLQPSRKAVLQRVAEASSPDLMLDKVRHQHMLALQECEYPGDFALSCTYRCSSSCGNDFPLMHGKMHPWLASALGSDLT